MNILGKAEDPRFWTYEVRVKDLYKNYREDCFNYWEKENLENKVFPALKYSDYKLFWTTGDRAIYEKTYFDRRSALEFTLPLALMYPEEEKYITKIMDWIYMICDEYSWCLPAHQGKLDPNNNSRIDLFASECGFWLAMINKLLGDRLDPLIRNRIMYELERRVVTPFLATECYDWWEVGHMNWTAVCTCGVAAVFMLAFPERMDQKLINRFNAAMDSFLEGFGDDGICLEGCGYWAYGVGFFVQYADMIRRFTNGTVDYFKIPKIKAISTFPQKMFLSDNASVSFADGGRKLEYTIGVLHRLKTEYPDDVIIYSPKYAAYGLGCGRVGYRIFTAAWMVEEYYNHPADSTAAFECFAEDSEWFIKRTEHYGFAAKAGNNDEFHNHNDVGSFIFAKGGKQLLCDLGSGKYTRQYFDNKTRYSILECSSLGHSLPIIGGAAQAFGAEHRANDVRFSSGRLSINIAGAYGLKDLTSLYRTFVMTDSDITVTDEYDYSGDGIITERLISVIEPEILDTGAIKIDDAIVKYDSTLCDVAVTKTAGTSAGNKVVYLIDFTLKPGIKTFGYTIT